MRNQQEKRLPKKISLAGIDVDVVQRANLAKDTGAIGQSIYEEQTILIDPDVSPPDTTNQALIHELVHWILFVMNEFSLKDNEKFVDIFSHLLYQSLKDIYPEEKQEET